MTKKSTNYFLLWTTFFSVGSSFPVDHATASTPIRAGQSSSLLPMVATSFGDFLKTNPSAESNKFAKSSNTVAEEFMQAWSAKRITTAMELVDDAVEFEDAYFPGPFVGKAELERVLRLLSDVTTHQFIIDDVAADVMANKVGIQFHTQLADGSFGKKSAISFDLNQESGLIQKAFLIQENNKSGEANLKTLSGASKIIEATSSKKKENVVVTTAADTTTPSVPSQVWWPFTQVKQSPSSSLTLPEQYFAAWNERDMGKACSLFSENCEYDDTAFPSPFRGKEVLEAHLNTCADCFPVTFAFKVDDQVDGGDKLFVRWHVENDGAELPFTRGCSFYNIDGGKITKGMDFVEPAVFKTGGLELAVKSIAAKITEEPIRLVPLATWVAYMYVVFFSDWFYGLPATALEQRTWEEVRDLSLNFFLVSPLLHLPFAPVVHPMLEGVFNLLLSWAALFAGFLSDDRKEKPNLLPMLPMVAGMQFLTSAFLLPYLVTRSSESNDHHHHHHDHDGEIVSTDDLPQVAQVTESRLLAPFLTLVGTGSIFWGVFARTQDFGGWTERCPSFLELLSIDRVGSSFLVDLAIFALFQGWFVDDDLQRRGMDAASPLGRAAKCVPFFGMAAYLTFRTPLASTNDAKDDLL